MAFYAGCSFTTFVLVFSSLFFPHPMVSPYTIIIPEQKCMKNEGVDSYRPAHSISSGKVICNNGAIFYFTFKDQELMKGGNREP